MTETVQTFKFIGWVDKLSATTKYGKDIYVRTLKDEEGQKFPQKVMFSISTRNLEKIDMTPFIPGSKVEIIFIPYLVQGVSKTNKAYTINKMMLQHIILLEHAEVDKSTGKPVDVEDMPF